ncbi:alpha-1,4-glucan lyase [Sphaerosporella brunnea]|uniref:alpha-glucosidase n=1 Tax=Sphaerosporella brunnea TaxID=1250544 RepID=A0A5J5EHD7_9PEZI|nr:alpha-1,4-glucan lyase [Sphaerosporella brunnea]
MAGLGDPIKFVKAEDFFNAMNIGDGWKSPTKVVSITVDPPTDLDPSNPSAADYYHGVTVTFDDGTLAAIQFIRPTVFRVRYDPAVKSRDEYGDANSRAILQDYTTRLVKVLDEYRNIRWKTELTEEKKGDEIVYWQLKSEVTFAGDPPKFNDNQDYQVGDGIKLIIYRSPFRIQAIRKLQLLKPLYPMPGSIVSGNADGNYRVIWETSPKTFRWHQHPQHAMLKDIVLDVIKPGHGEYMGFGEQGGTSFAKTPTFMNYFNCDNMQYQQVYNQGPLDSREPLYHSDPYFFEVNANPEHANVTATFIDNFSQIAIDFGKTNAGYIKLGTRFNAMDVYIMTADNARHIVRLQSGLVGRGMLKPRYVLGNHQACYGYSTTKDLNDCVNGYRNAGIPLDGLHADVDFQDEFRTFTMNPDNDPGKMFGDLRGRGIKCSTNITPVISVRDKTQHRPEGYKTLQEGLRDKRFLADVRYTTGTSGYAKDVRYVNYGGGNYYEVDPNDHSKRPDFGDDYDFESMFNRSTEGNWVPYRGAVSYGYGNGTPGHYVDLSTEDNRKWWGQQYEDLFNWGLEFVWQDMTTPAIADAYGDMKGLPSRLVIPTDSTKTKVTHQLAIEAWALYSLNLHKATFHGLGRLAVRKNKRNFILGRGSFATMYRFAGLWTGDNASTWDFWRITIPQVLSVGLNGVSICGSDTGGFEPGRLPGGGEARICPPELLMRWYAGSFLLPWLRNHYVKKDRKDYQEPFNYAEPVPSVVRFYIQLRYSLMQVLYDAMFENILDGMPIARSMLLTDYQDASFFNESQRFLDNQYVCLRDILVAPIMQSAQEKPDQSREVYLPLGNFWYQSNLMPWDDQGSALLAPVEGGTVINYSAPIRSDYDSFRFIVPTFIREGAIIPQLQVRQNVDSDINNPNHLKLNIYPGKDRNYTLYLDDGVSRTSAPTGLPQIVQPMLQAKAENPDHVGGWDEEAKSEFRMVVIEQTTTDPSVNDSARTIVIRKAHDNYGPEAQVGFVYTLVVYYLAGVDPADIEVTVQAQPAPPTTLEFERGSPTGYKSETDLRAVIVRINETIGTSKEVTVTLTPKKA